MRRTNSIIAICLIGAAAFALAYRPHSRTPVPFTATFEARDSHGELLQLIRTARRSDGATFKSEILFNGMYTVSVELPDGSRTTLAPSLKERTTWPRLQGEPLGKWYAKKLPAQACNQGRLKLVGTSYFQAEPVELREKVVQDAKLTFTLAPRLGFEELRYTWVNATSGALVSQGHTTQLDYGDPDQKLYEVPSDYVETRPSVLAAQQAKQKKAELSESDERANRKADRAYDALPR